MEEKSHCLILHQFFCSDWISGLSDPRGMGVSIFNMKKKNNTCNFTLSQPFIVPHSVGIILKDCHDLFCSTWETEPSTNTIDRVCSDLFDLKNKWGRSGGCIKYNMCSTHRFPFPSWTSPPSPSARTGQRTPLPPRLSTTCKTKITRAFLKHVKVFWSDFVYIWC